MIRLFECLPGNYEKTLLVTCLLAVIKQTAKQTMYLDCKRRSSVWLDYRLLIVAKYQDTSNLIYLDSVASTYLPL